MSAAPTQNVNFWANPAAALSPDLVVQQQQIDRQNQMVAYLRQQALEPIDPGKGSISWTQGMAKLAQALAGGISQRGVDKRQNALNYAMANQVRQANGLAPLPMPGQKPQKPQMQQPAPTAPAMIGQQGAPTDMSSIAMGGGSQVAPQQPAQASPGVARIAAALSSQQAPQQDPAQGSPGPAPPQATAGASSQEDAQQPAGTMQRPQSFPRQPMIPQFPGMSPAANMIQQSIDQQGYMHDVRTANMPEPLQKLVAARNAAAAGGDWDSARTYDTQIQKLNNADIAVRQGGIYNPITKQFDAYMPAPIPGVAPTFTNGMPTGTYQIPGSREAMAANARAESGGKAAGQAPYEPVTVTDSDGKTYQLPKLAAFDITIH